MSGLYRVLVKGLLGSISGVLTMAHMGGFSNWRAQRIELVVYRPA